MRSPYDAGAPRLIPEQKLRTVVAEARVRRLETEQELIKQRLDVLEQDRNDLETLLRQQGMI
jgi:hypothetical protein